jgi:hypothetical protein
MGPCFLLGLPQTGRTRRTFHRWSCHRPPDFSLGNADEDAKDRVGAAEAFLTVLNPASVIE